ncbi:MAG: DUF1194 domain-containing protein [Verrucomicrobiaceae bacterium]|nr:MAG: DUF1194 domain-containing protein [Verrucomicrobiaceae bacterium]
MTTPQQKSNSAFRARFRPPFAGVLIAGLAVSGLAPQARAVNVDTEIVLLVDIVQPELSNNDFKRLMNGYADAFTSSQVIDSIQSGVFGRIAVSMMFYGGSTLQVVSVPWMSISNAAEAQTFASTVRNLSRPNSVVYSDAGSALTAAARSFGTETGHAGNGYESAAQIIEVATAGIPSTYMANATKAAKNNALASGVDLINAIALGTFSSSINNFYSANVIGSTIDGVSPGVTNANFNGGLASTMNHLLTESVQTGVAVSVTSVPEPSALVGLLPATLLLLRRRRN